MGSLQRKRIRAAARLIGGVLGADFGWLPGRHKHA
jgi:hypothetical protein